MKPLRPSVLRRTVHHARSDEGPGARPPTIPELVWMEEMRLHLREPDTDIRSIAELSDLVDRYCVVWHQTPDPERWDPDFVMTAIAVAVGDLLVTHGGGHWAVLDGSPIVLAVRGDDGHLVVPRDVVAHRWFMGRTDWLAEFVAEPAAAPRVRVLRGAARA